MGEHEEPLQQLIRLMTPLEIEAEFVGLLQDAAMRGAKADRNGWIPCGQLGTDVPSQVARFNIRSAIYEVAESGETMDLIVATRLFHPAGFESDTEALRFLRGKHQKPETIRRPVAPSRPAPVANVFMQAALRYAEMGYAVFPCAVNGKQPITSNGLHSATTDQDTIEQWWSSNPRANIGLVTNGLLVVDIDGADNPWPPAAQAKDLMAAPTSQTPRGGTHHYFRQPDGAELRNSAGKLADKVDTRADGGYVIVAPSVNEMGAYRWLPDAELDVSADRLPEPPPWLLAKLREVQARKPLSSQKNSSPPSEEVIKEGGRNAGLMSLAGSMRNRGMSQEAMLAALLVENQTRCVPPLDDEEVRQIAGSAGRYPAGEMRTDQPNGKLPPGQGTGWFVDSGGKLSRADEMLASQLDAADSGGEEAGEEEARNEKDPGPIPLGLLEVPGFISDVMNHTLETAPYADKALAFAGALALQAFLSGRKVRDSMNNRTAFYILALAGSGTGKDHPRKVNQQILSGANLSDCMGESFASGEGIEDRLLATPSVLYQVDEIDSIMKKIKEGKEGRFEGIMERLLRVYTASNGEYKSRDKAGKTGERIQQPSIVLFGTAVPKHFYESLSLRMMTNGLFARMLVIEAERRGKGRPVPYKPVPHSLVTVAEWWKNFGSLGGNLSGMFPDATPDPLGVPADHDAIEILTAFQGQCDQLVFEAEDREDEAHGAMWSRAFEKALRLSLIYACSRDRFGLLVTGDAAWWACELVNHQTRRMLYRSSTSVAESPFDQKCKELLSSLLQWEAKQPGEWMPFWKINRRHRWTDKDHTDVRTSLLNQQRIFYTEKATGGTPKRLYRIRFR